jgi:hypothetical protein
MCDNVSEALDRASVRCILSKRNMRTPPVIIGGEFRKNPPQVLFVEHDQMIGTLAPDRPDQAFNMTVLPLRSGPYHAGAFGKMVLAQGLGNEDRQAPRDEEGDRGAGASVGRDHAPHMG